MKGLLLPNTPVPSRIILFPRHSTSQPMNVIWMLTRLRLCRLDLDEAVSTLSKLFIDSLWRLKINKICLWHRYFKLKYDYLILIKRKKSLFNQLNYLCWIKANLDNLCHCLLNICVMWSHESLNFSCSVHVLILLIHQINFFILFTSVEKISNGKEVNKFGAA